MLFESYFTSYDLLKDLASMNMKTLGTVRENRTLEAEIDVIVVKDRKNFIKKYMISVSTEKSTANRTTPSLKLGAT